MQPAVAFFIVMFIVGMGLIVFGTFTDFDGIPAKIAARSGWDDEDA